MGIKSKIDSLVNHTDNCSTGNMEAGLVNGWEFASIPNNILKSKTPTGMYFSLNGKALLQCCGAGPKGCSSLTKSKLIN